MWGENMYDYSELMSVEYMTYSSSYTYRYPDGTTTTLNTSPNSIKETYRDKDGNYYYRVYGLGLYNEGKADEAIMAVYAQGPFDVGDCGNTSIATMYPTGHSPLRLTRREFLGRLIFYYISAINDNNRFMVYNNWKYKDVQFNLRLVLNVIMPNGNISYGFYNLDAPVLAIYSDNGEQVWCSAYYDNGVLYNYMSNNYMIYNFKQGHYKMKLLKTGKGITTFENGTYEYEFDFNSETGRWYDTDGNYRAENNQSQYLSFGSITKDVNVTFSCEYMEYIVEYEIVDLGDDITKLEGYEEITSTIPSYQEARNYAEQKFAEYFPKSNETLDYRPFYYNSSYGTDYYGFLIASQLSYDIPKISLNELKKYPTGTIKHPIFFIHSYKHNGNTPVKDCGKMDITMVLQDRYLPEKLKVIDIGGKINTELNENTEIYLRSRLSRDNAIVSIEKDGRTLKAARFFNPLFSIDLENTYSETTSFGRAVRFANCPDSYNCFVSETTTTHGSVVPSLEYRNVQPNTYDKNLPNTRITTKAFAASISVPVRLVDSGEPRILVEDVYNEVLAVEDKEEAYTYIEKWQDRMSEELAQEYSHYINCKTTGENNGKYTARASTFKMDITIPLLLLLNKIDLVTHKEELKLFDMQNLIFDPNNPVHNENMYFWYFIRSSSVGETKEIPIISHPFLGASRSHKRSPNYEKDFPEYYNSLPIKDGYYVPFYTIDDNYTFTLDMEGFEDCTEEDFVNNMLFRHKSIDIDLSEIPKR